MKHELSKERLEELRDYFVEMQSIYADPADRYNYDMFRDAEEMARRLLAIEEQVLKTCPIEIRDLIATHSDALFDDHDAQIIWDACRAAMLSNEPVSEPYKLRENIRREHAAWSQSTFGNVGPAGPLKHLSKEAIEAAEAPDDLSEWADMQFLLWDAQRRAGITDEQITLAMFEKLTVNKARIWPEPKDGEPRLHITAAPQPEIPGE